MSVTKWDFLSFRQIITMLPKHGQDGKFYYVFCNFFNYIYQITLHLTWGALIKEVQNYILKISEAIKCPTTYRRIIEKKKKIKGKW